MAKHTIKSRRQMPIINKGIAMIVLGVVFFAIMTGTFIVNLIAAKFFGADTQLSFVPGIVEPTFALGAVCVLYGLVLMAIGHGILQFTHGLHQNDQLSRSEDQTQVLRQLPQFEGRTFNVHVLVPVSVKQTH